MIDGSNINARQKDYSTISRTDVAYALKKLRRLALMNGIELELKADYPDFLGSFLVSEESFRSRTQQIEIEVYDERILKQETLSCAIASMRSFECEIANIGDGILPSISPSSRSNQIMTFSDEFEAFVCNDVFVEGDRLPIILNGNDKGVILFISKRERRWYAQIDWVDGPDELVDGDEILTWSITNKHTHFGTVKLM